MEKYINDKEAVNISRHSDYNDVIIREMQNETICMLLLNSSQLKEDKVIKSSTKEICGFFF